MRCFHTLKAALPHTYRKLTPLDTRAKRSNLPNPVLTMLIVCGGVCDPACGVSDGRKCGGKCVWWGQEHRKTRKGERDRDREREKKKRDRARKMKSAERLGREVDADRKLRDFQCPVSYSIMSACDRVCVCVGVQGAHVIRCVCVCAYVRVYACSWLT